MNPTRRAVAARAASLLLRYPDQSVREVLPTLTAAVTEELPTEVARPLLTVAQWLTDQDPGECAAGYVATFDFRRRHTLHLTYYSHGDTRARGEVLAELAAVYRNAGYRPIAGELPDYLPAVLDLAAAAGEPGWRVLTTYRVGLDLLAAALERDESIYRHAAVAVQRLLPPATPGDEAAARQRAGAGPPTESVGLEPFPLTGTAGGRR